jgi:hypothetical protein
MLLFVQNIVLSASNDTSILNTANGLGDSVTRQVWVRGEALPVALAKISSVLSLSDSSKAYTTLGVATKRTDNRTKLNVNTLATVLQTHLVSSTVEFAAIPGCSDSTTCWESGNIVGEAYT